LNHRQIRGTRALALAIFAALIGPPDPAAAERPADSAAAAHLPGQLVVDFTPAATAEQRRQVRASVGSAVEKVLPGTAAEVLDLGPGQSVAKARERLERNPAVRYAEPNFRLVPHAATGDDPLRGEQWALDRTGVPAAWNLTTGTRDVVVAVLDSGVDIRHPDLAGDASTGPNLWTNPGESGSGRETNEVDDDGNGYVDDARGWNFWGHPDPTDYNGHGTAAAGIIGAIGGNGAGITGLNRRVRIMPLQVWNDGTAGVAEALHYAASHGVRVANGSFGIPFSQVIEDALAANPQILLSVSAGNQAWDVEQNPGERYPCVSRLPNVVCVAATDRDDSLAGFSNWGATSVDLGAPGVDLLTLGLPRRISEYEDFVTPLEGRWATGGAGNRWAVSGDVGEWPTQGRDPVDLDDSPGGPYEPNSDSRVEMEEGIDLTGYDRCGGSYVLQRSDLGAGDVLRLEASAQGVDWTLLAERSGSSNSAGGVVDLTAFEGRPNLRLRFRLVSDDTGEGRGVRIGYTYVYCYRGTYRGDEYPRVSGTSFAAPQVSGAAALLLAHKPWLTTAELRGTLLGTVEPLGHLAGRTVTGGRLDVSAALAGRRPAAAPARQPVSPVKPRAVAKRPLMLRVRSAGKEAKVRPLVCRPPEVPCLRRTPPEFKPRLPAGRRPLLRVFASERASTVRLRRRDGGRLVGKIIARNRVRGRFRVRLPALRGRSETYYVTMRYPGGRSASGTLKLRRTQR